MPFVREQSGGTETTVLKGYGIGLVVQKTFFKKYKNFTVDKGCTLKQANTLPDTDGTTIATLSSGVTYNVTDYTINTDYVNFRSLGDSIVVTLIP